MSAQAGSAWKEQAKERALRNEKRADSAVGGLMTLYDEAAYKMEQEIRVLYARFAQDNGLTAAQAAQLISGKEYSVWKKSMEKAIADASGPERDSKALLELKALIGKGSISRKDKLLANVYRDTMELAGSVSSKLEEQLGDILRANYYEGCFAVQRGLGLAFRTAELDGNFVRQALEAPFSGKHFSQAVLEHCDRMAALAKREITLGLTGEAGAKQMAKAVHNVMDSGRNAARRLARTECAYFANLGELEAYKRSGIRRYRFTGGSEGGAHCACAALSNKTFDVGQAEPGVNFPPIHPNCRCTIVADLERGSFDIPKDAKPFRDNVDFEQWKKKYVENQNANGIIKGIDLQPIPITQDAINRVPVVEAATLSKKQSLLLAQREKELLKVAMNEPAGREVAFCCDMKMKKINQFMGKGLYSVHSAGRNSPHVLIHNHPSGQTFTHQDIINFMNKPKMQILVAVGNEGSVYLVEKTMEYDEKGFHDYFDNWMPNHPDLLESPEKYITYMKEMLGGAEEHGVYYVERKAREV